MKKVGILTFHGSHNYGSVLQAYALSSQVQSMGYEVQIINLRNNAQKAAYRIFRPKGHGIKKLIYSAYTLAILPKLKRRAKRFESFIQNTLPITKREYHCGAELVGNTDFDIYLCGSDQIWNPACQDFESAYYLDFVSNGAKRVAYAPSLGKAVFPEKHKQLIASLLPGVDCISVREPAAAALLSQLTDKPVEVVCDPVVLLGRERWEAFAVPPKINEPYILTYFLENNHGSKEYLDELQRMTGYKVVALNEDIRNIGKHYISAYDASPREFVGLFRNAAFVYTNSFHGTAFATIFNRPFLTVISKSTDVYNNNDSRKIDYLTSLGLEKRLLTKDLPLKEDLLLIDYSEANQKMINLRNASLAYLSNALK